MTIEADDIDAVITTLFDLFQSKGQTLYDPGVTQLQHALQCAALAVREAASDAEVVAALLHDVGHLLTDEHREREDFLAHDLAHEELGADWLERFGAPVARLVRLHVPAKRYLCRVDSGYWAALSEASKRSLQVQGGPMTPSEAASFTTLPCAAAALSLRKRDDRAKQRDLRVPPLPTYRALLDRQLRLQR